MKTKEISVEISKSKNYQTYKCSKTFILDEKDDEEACTLAVQAWCRKKVMQQIELDK